MYMVYICYRDASILLPQQWDRQQYNIS